MLHVNLQVHTQMHPPNRELHWLKPWQCTQAWKMTPPSCVSCFDYFGKNNYIRLSPFAKHVLPPICGFSSWSRFSSSPAGNGAHGLLEVHEFFKPCAGFDKGDCNVAKNGAPKMNQITTVFGDRVWWLSFTQIDFFEMHPTQPSSSHPICRAQDLGQKNPKPRKTHRVFKVERWVGYPLS